MTEITEVIGRSALLAAASNYRSVAEALMELIDNPFDKRHGRHLTIDVVVDKKGDRVVITDQGGEGMNDAGLQGWIRWGEGERHATDDIGQYHVGGKLAGIYLAEEIDIVCRKAGEDTIWRFHDPHWGSRTTALDASPLATIGGANLRWPDGAPQPGIGFTRVTLRGLKEHRYDTAILRERLSDTYRSLIKRKQCTIRVNGEQIGTRHIPWSSTIDVVEIPRIEVLKGVKVTGRIGAIDRDQVPDTRGFRIPAGVRTEFNGRKITDGEEFGYKLSGKGNLQRVYGEIEIQGRGLKPNQLKNGWPQDSKAWTALEAVMKEHMGPIVAHLGSISEARPATREERKRASSARQRVQDALRRLQLLRNGNGGDPGADGEGSAGRKRAERSRNEEKDRDPSGGPRSPVKVRTDPPPDAVGRLLRRVGGMPQVIYDSLGQQTERTQWRDQENGGRAIVINKDYPLYASLGSNEDYVFESIVSHLVYDETQSVQEARELFDRIVWLDKAQPEAA